MSHLGSSQWWWNTAFDGIASSLVTAAIAIVGVVAALKHDRDLAEEIAFRQECTSLSRTARVLDHEFGAAEKGGGGWTMVHHQMVEFAADLTNFAAARTEKEPNLARIIDAAAHVILDNFWGPDRDIGKLDAGIETVRATLANRVRMPKHLQKMPVEQVDTLVEGVHAGHPVSA